MRRLVLVVVVLLIAHAGFRVIPKYLNNFQFKAETEEIARFSGTKTQAGVEALVLDAAKKHALPVTASGIRVRRMAERTMIDVAYSQPLEVLPRYFYVWNVEINIDSFIANVRIRDLK
jgi:hypothetical protein